MNKTEDTEAFEQLLRGEAEKLTQQFAGAFRVRYAPMQEEIEAVGDTSLNNQYAFVKLSLEIKDVLIPQWRNFYLNQVDLEDVSLFKFMGTIANALSTGVDATVSNLQSISTAYRQLKPMFKGSADFGALSIAEEAAINLISAARTEYKNSLQFNNLISAVYLSTKREYKKLRKKFLGENAAPEKHDEFEEQMLMQLFGLRPPQQSNITGAAVSLIDDNCVLTQLLDDLTKSIPRYYERTVPIVRKGVITSKTKTIKQLDNGEEEDFGQTLISIADPITLGYVKAPDTLLAKILNLLQQYYDLYDKILEPLSKLMTALNVETSGRQDMINPRQISRQYKRINFLAIRPLAEDIVPRTRVEREFAAARISLLTHLNETLHALSTMEGDKYEFASTRVKELIDLKAKLDEVNKTERDKELARNIEDDNEFYVSKSGNLGSIEYQREPAPRITYKDVVGDTFIKAKAHVEEVVKIASHANVMRISAPRGDVRSNLMLIGPYGCGKTEMAKAIASDKRIIGFSLGAGDLLTAYMHESVKNVKRMFEAAKEMRKQSRNTKPVAILLDEFDRLFSYGEGVHQAYDGKRMEGALQEMMDGVVGYEGIFLVALTNIPKAVPAAILRRFKYVDVVGQLTKEERAKLFKQFLTRGLPIAPGVTEDHYLAWAEKMADAPGDVIGKVADEVHFKFMNEFISSKKSRTEIIEKTLRKRLKDRDINTKDHNYLKQVLSGHRLIEADEVDTALESVLKQPQVRMQIRTAREVYRDAEEIMNSLTLDKGIGFGATVGRKGGIWDSNS